MATREPEPNASSDPFEVDLDAVSTDRLTAVLDAARADPDFSDEVPGLVLVLAERHFTSGAYDLAFERYAEVVEHPESRPPQFAVALSRLAWIGWLSNGDTPAALTTLDQAVRIDPDNAETIYIRGQVQWCGADDAAAAADEFERVLDAPDLATEVRAQVEGDLEAIRAGERCG